MFGGAGLGKSSYNGAHKKYSNRDGGLSLFAGVGERTREGNDLYYEMQDSSIISRTDLPSFHRKNIFYTSTQVHSVNTNSLVALVFGQMNETPGARMRVSHVSLTMAEYFRDALHQDVLIFIDNVFRFLQAGSEVSTLLGRMPSAVGYQPTLCTEMGSKLQDVIAILGLEELYNQDRVIVNRARKIERFLSQPFFVAEIFTRIQGSYVSLDETIHGFSQIICPKGI